MSRKRPRRQPSASVKVIDQKPNNGLSLSTRITMDELMNEYARLGGQENLLGNDRYRPMRLTQNFNLLNTLYRGSWIIGRIVDVVAEDMTKNWYKLKCQIEPEFEARLTRLERKAHVKEKILEGMKWGRLYGGAAGIIVLEGQEDMLDQPLDLNMVSPGSFKGILIADRWSGVYPSSELVTDIGDPDEGLPMYYIFSMDEANLDYGVKVHHSRVIRFTGKKLPYIERVIELHWGMSEVERVFEELNKRDATSSNIAQLIFQAHLRVLKMEHLGQDLAFMDADASGDLYRTLQAQNKLMNNMSLQVLSKDDDFQTFQYTFSGLSDVYELFMMDLAGAAEIPVTRLFGRSPAGLNATGESDLTNYYDKIRKDQNAFLSPILDKLLPVMCLSAWGAIPDDLDFDFNPIRDIAEEERANLIKQSADAINQAFQSGLISQKIALKELRQSGESLDMWTNIQDEDIENADDTMGQPEQEPQMEEDPEQMPNPEQQEGPKQPPMQSGKPGKNSLGKNVDQSPGLLDRLKTVLRSILTRDYNDNHDPHSGRFAPESGGVSGGASSSSGGFRSEQETKQYVSGSPRVNRQEIKKHVKGTPEFTRYQETRKATGKPPQSFFDPKDEDAVHREVMEKLRNGDYELRPKKDGSYRAYLHIESAKGTAYNNQGVESQSSLVEVTISKKKGIHYYAIPEGGNEP